MPSSVAFAYGLVVIIWSTTPLGIIWSSDSVSPSMAVLLRMLIATFLGLIVIKLNKIEFPWHRLALKLYFFSAMGVFGGMLLVYLSARYLSSGTISLIFGLAPIFSGLLSIKLLGEPPLSRIKLIALTTALFGLAVVFWDGLSINSGAWPGYLLILGSVLFFCLSGILIKSVPIAIHPIATTAGALILSLPGFIISWWLLDGTIPVDQWQEKAIYAILYLGVFGSFIGFVAYYYILQKLPATTVVLVTLITPVIAMLLGHWLNQEVIGYQLVIGALGVIVGLGLYQFGDRVFKRI